MFKNRADCHVENMLQKLVYLKMEAGSVLRDD